MKIAVDARELAGKPTGVGRYLAELLACWSREPSAARHEILLLTPGLLRLPAGLIGTGGARVDSHVVPGNSPGADRGGLGHLAVGAASAAGRGGQAGRGCAVLPGLFGPDLFAGAGGRVDPRRVVLGASRMVQGREGLRRRLTTWASAHRARLVLTLTAFSRDEIIRWLDVSPRRVRAIAPGAGGFFDPATSRDASPSVR